VVVDHWLSVHHPARQRDGPCCGGAILTPFFEQVESTGSTNADLAARLRSGERLAEAHWLRADRQSGGRGRRGRDWDSPPGNLYCSTIVRLGPADRPAHALSFVTALAVDDLLNHQLRTVSHGVPRLKWPNDVLVNGAKICGILLEQIGDCVIVGIGINVTHAPQLPDRATTSIHALNGVNANTPQQILEYLAPLFAARVAQWRTAGLGAILSAWEARAHPRGTPIVVAGEAEEPITGSFAGLDPSGALRLRLDDGSERAIHAADVSLI
jgi:BirA family transcriptional regulator, biotin operon repressor / biotin---[acetyl-CoA-carboxylase] ligase